MLQAATTHRKRRNGLKLSRFDKVLGLTRDRIRTVYRGVPPRAALRVV